jgi:hypothetical protein
MFDVDTGLFIAAIVATISTWSFIAWLAMPRKRQRNL